MARGQVSMEYLVIVGVALGLLIPAVMFFYSYSKSGEISSTSTQVNDIGLDLLATIKGTYALGKNSRQTLEFNMPERVSNVYVGGPDNKELVFVYETEAGVSESVFFSDIELITTYSDGNVSIVHPGLTKYKMESLGLVINISEELN